MNSIRTGEWQKLAVSLAELSLDTTLRCGQSFRWKKLNDDEWTCSLRGRVISLKQDPKQDPNHLLYKVTWPANSPLTKLPSGGKGAKVETDSMKDDTEALLRHYFNLGPNLTELYERWSKADPNFKKRAPKFTGVRVLKQDAWEALVGFICSSNNNIARISQMVNNLCLSYGPLIGHVHDQSFHDFPSPEDLAGPEVESQLRKLGFGYRAKYLARTAIIVSKEKPENWLESLSNTEPFDESEWKTLEPGGRPGYRKAHEELLALQGVGPKVADCVCLMGLGWGESVPVDTHVWQIAQRDYKFGKGKHKSLTKATYDAIGNHFRVLWGEEAGWAHSVLFAADLRTFAIRLTEKSEVEEVKIKGESEDGVVVQATVVKKREAIKAETTKEELIKEEAADDLNVVFSTASKRRRR
ncbi:hypothetical protein O988_00629 [Pseudogymnoascus sp. VKM F-3808]|nr:hypothetical protein O988_00629 [Pseudogymnoascus sp. VKM F-3808]